MEDFMSELADDVWPQDKGRAAFCYAHRHGKVAESCNAKEGNPFGPFWDTFGVDFDSSQTYGPLHYDVHHTAIAAEWGERYPAEVWPVLAFTGAPASFPVQKENVGLQRYFEWSDEVMERARGFIKENLAGGPYVGIHLRNGVDWVRNLNSIKSSFMSPMSVTESYVLIF